MRLLAHPMSRRTALAVPPLAVAASQLAGSPAQGASRSPALSIRGADISFTPQLEAAGVRFSDRGKVRPVERILADHGPRRELRAAAGVDRPSRRVQRRGLRAGDRRAKRAGMKVLLNLHYSDFWADPAHQTTPAAWQGQDLPTLAAPYAATPAASWRTSPAKARRST